MRVETLFAAEFALRQAARCYAGAHDNRTHENQDLAKLRSAARLFAKLAEDTDDACAEDEP